MFKDNNTGKSQNVWLCLTGAQRSAVKVVNYLLSSVRRCQVHLMVRIATARDSTTDDMFIALLSSPSLPEHLYLTCLQLH